MKMRRILTVIFIVIGGLAIIMSALIKKPISVDADTVKKVEVCVTFTDENDEIFFVRTELLDREEINEFISELNDIRARSVSDVIKRGKQYIHLIIVVIHTESDYLEIRFRGNGYFSMYEGAEGDRYKMSEKRGIEFLEYVRKVCLSN